MVRKTVKIIPFKKGMEGQRYTQFALQDIQSGLFFSTREELEETDLYSENTIGFNTRKEAVRAADKNRFFVQGDPREFPTYAQSEEEFRKYHS